MQPYSVVFYRTQSGKCPILDFIKAQNVKTRAKTMRLIEILKMEGPLLREPESKSLGAGIFELRTTVETNAIRLLYFFTSSHTVVLTNGFIKKSRRTPVHEIELAKRYRSDYMTRTGE